MAVPVPSFSYFLFREIKGVLGRLVFEHFARCHVNNQSRPEKNVYPIDSLNAFVEVQSLGISLVFGRDYIVLAAW